MKKFFIFSFLIIIHFFTEGIEVLAQQAPEALALKFPEISDKFMRFCSVISHRDIICEDGASRSISEVFTPSESLQFSTDLKIGGITYIYPDSSVNLRFQVPYKIRGVCHDRQIFCYVKNKGINTLNFFLKTGCSYSDILSGYQSWSTPTIRNFATNVLTIINRQASEEGLNEDEKALTPSIQVGALILTSERLRSEKSILISYIEFYKLQHNPTTQRMDQMFFGGSPTLRFPGSRGQDRIWKMAY